MGTEKPHNETSKQERCQLNIFKKINGLKFSAFEGRKTCNAAACSRTPTLHPPQERLAALNSIQSPHRAPGILCQPEAIGAETVSLGKPLFSIKPELVKRLLLLPSRPGFPQPSPPVLMTAPLKPTTYKSQGLTAISPTYVVPYIDIYLNIRYVRWDATPLPNAHRSGEAVRWGPGLRGSHPVVGTQNGVPPAQGGPELLWFHLSACLWFT